MGAYSRVGSYFIKIFLGGSYSRGGGAFSKAWAIRRLTLALNEKILHNRIRRFRPIFMHFKAKKSEYLASLYWKINFTATEVS